jgi:hypothetical protein
MKKDDLKKMKDNLKKNERRTPKKMEDDLKINRRRPQKKGRQPQNKWKKTLQNKTFLDSSQI